MRVRGFLTPNWVGCLNSARRTVKPGSNGRRRLPESGGISRQIGSKRMLHRLYFHFLIRRQIAYGSAHRNRRQKIRQYFCGFKQMGLSGLPRAGARGFGQKALKIAAQRYFHFRLCVFKAARLNSYRELLAAAIPAVIREPELAFDAQKWRDPKRYGVIPHTPSPNNLSLPVSS